MKVLRMFNDSYVLDLTKYEVGNGTWKENSLQHAIQEEEPYELLDSLRTVIHRANPKYWTPGTFGRSLR